MLNRATFCVLFVPCCPAPMCNAMLCKLLLCWINACYVVGIAARLIDCINRSDDLLLGRNSNNDWPIFAINSRRTEWDAEGRMRTPYRDVMSVWYGRRRLVCWDNNAHWMHCTILSHGSMTQHSDVVELIINIGILHAGLDTMSCIQHPRLLLYQSHHYSWFCRSRWTNN